MKKIIYSMLALMAMTFAACSDVPEPYMNPNNHKGGGDEPAEGVYVEATFSNKIDPFEVITTKGNAWVINYNTATATGYNSSEKTNTESESYLVSPEFDLTESAGAYLEFEYIFRYANRAGEDKVLITANYTDDPTTTEWVDITGTLTEGSDWQTFAKYSSNLPEEFIGEAGIRIALYYSATATDSRTWEVKNLKVMEGQTEEGGEEGGEVTPVDGGEGDGTEAAPYNVTAAKAATGNGKYVKGFIVGYVDGKSLEEGAKFEAGGTTNILIATAADEKNVVNCMPIQLPTEVAAAGIRSGLNLTDNPTLLGKEIVLYGNLVSYFGTTGLKETSYAKVGDKEYGTKPGSTPVDPSGGKLYYIDFKTSQEGWTVQDVTLPAGFTHVWNVDTKYGYVATTYNKTDKKDCDGEGLIISPKIDLSKATAAKLTVSNSGSYFESDAKMKEQIGVLISTDGTNWTPLEITTWPVYNKFTWVNSTFDLAAYAGKADVQIAFKYIGTATKAGTWEIGTVTIE